MGRDMSLVKKAAAWIWGNFDKVIAAGGLALSFIGSAWVSYLTAAMSSYSPLSWLACGFLGLLITSLVFWLGAFGYSKILLARRTAEIMAEISVNPLEERFERKKIRLGDFYNPQYLAHKNKDFRNCHIAGPGLVYFKGLHADGVEFRQVQIVIGKSDPVNPITIWGVTTFENCKFVGGAFTELTMLMDKATYNSLPSHLKANVPVISDGL